MCGQRLHGPHPSRRPCKLGLHVCRPSSIPLIISQPPSGAWHATQLIICAVEPVKSGFSRDICGTQEWGEDLTDGSAFAIGRAVPRRLSALPTSQARPSSDDLSRLVFRSDVYFARY